MISAIDRGDYWPGCPRPACHCHQPGPVCDEWMGLDGDLDGTEDDLCRRWCPRCGWAEHLHPEKIKDARRTT